MPYVMHMPPEGTDKLSPYVCSVVMGYPMVVRNSQNPEKQYGVKFDTPIFHWFSKKDRRHDMLSMNFQYQRVRQRKLIDRQQMQEMDLRVNL